MRVDYSVDEEASGSSRERGTGKGSCTDVAVALPSSDPSSCRVAASLRGTHLGRLDRADPQKVTYRVDPSVRVEPWVVRLAYSFLFSLLVQGLGYFVLIKILGREKV